MFRKGLTTFALTPVLALTMQQGAMAFTPPTIDSSVASGTSRMAIMQVINSWAVRGDQGNAAEAAALFAPAAQLSLYFNDASSGQPKLTPTGYSASKTGIGGTPGGGCTVQGTGSITNFMAGRAPNFGPATTTTWPSTTYRTNLGNSLISFSDAQDATVRSYVVTFTGSPKTPLIYSGQILSQVQFSASAGWKITSMQIIFDTPEPNFPCQN